MKHVHFQNDLTTMAMPHNMDLICQIYVVVGYVHCNLNSHQIALALGYRSGSNELHYTLQQVRDVFGYVTGVASSPSQYNVYRLWVCTYWSLLFLF